MADIIASNLLGKKITETYKGLLHFDSALGVSEKPVYDGAGTKTALSLGADNDKAIINGDLIANNDLIVRSETTLQSNLSVNGNITLVDGGNLNDVTINESGNQITTRVLNTCEVGKLRIRESSTDFELIFGNPTENTPNLFSIIVKKDNTNNLYIKNNYSDPDINAPLWINRATGEVNIKMLNVGEFRNNINIGGSGSTGGSTSNKGGGLYPVGGIMMFTVAGVPTGWLECDGRILSINDYKVLYDVIGQNYKTLNNFNTISGFQIPDLRGEFVRGWDHAKGVDAGRSLGSSQKATGVRYLIDQYVGDASYPLGTFAINMGEVDDYIIGGYSTETSTVGSNTTYYQAQNTIEGTGIGDNNMATVRPRNIALIYCIKI
jgi:hypothetical protein